MPAKKPVAEVAITLHDGQIEFRVFIYREDLPVTTIEGTVDAESDRLVSLYSTDAISARTIKHLGVSDAS